jgi:hypothetical protein
MMWSEDEEWGRGGALVYRITPPLFFTSFPSLYLRGKRKLPFYKPVKVWDEGEGKTVAN